MGIAQYIDGILNLLEAAGVSQDEMDENRTSQKLSHAYTNGVDFEVAARELCRQHGVAIVTES
jgi:hypothetical protein